MFTGNLGIGTAARNNGQKDSRSAATAATHPVQAAAGAGASKSKGCIYAQDNSAHACLHVAPQKRSTPPGAAPALHPASSRSLSLATIAYFILFCAVLARVWLWKDPPELLHRGPLLPSLPSGTAAPHQLTQQHFVPTMPTQHHISAFSVAYPPLLGLHHKGPCVDVHGIAVCIPPRPASALGGVHEQVRDRACLQGVASKFLKRTDNKTCRCRGCCGWQRQHAAQQP